MITQPTEEYFGCGQWGWDGTRWRKLSLLWGYTDRYGEYIADTAMPAGSSNLTATAVPAGEVWRVLGYSASVTSASCTGWRIALSAGGTTIWLDEVVTPTTNVLYPRNVDVVLKEADFIYVRFYTMTLNDTAEFGVWGYKMAVT